MTPHPTDALLVIDMQNDFCPGGSLAVAEGDSIIPRINDLGSRFEHVILTQDWHPARHISFASAHPCKRPFSVTEVAYGPQSLWPDHCLQGSHGAALHSALDLPHAELILRKGFRREIDSYSAFLENDHATPTGLAGYLRERNLKRLFLCGLAYDFCIRFSAIDGAALGFECIVIEDASRPVDLPGSVDQTNAAFTEAGVSRLYSSNLILGDDFPMTSLDVVDHLVFRVLQLDRTACFYSAFLGDPSHQTENSIMYTAGDTRLFFTASLERQPRLHDKEAIGLNHIAFGVRALAELEAIQVQLDLAKLVHSGIGIDQYGHKEFIWLDDPDGLRIEFYLRSR